MKNLNKDRHLQGDCRTKHTSTKCSQNLLLNIKPCCFCLSVKIHFVFWIEKSKKKIDKNFRL